MLQKVHSDMVRDMTRCHSQLVKPTAFQDKFVKVVFALELFITLPG